MLDTIWKIVKIQVLFVSVFFVSKIQKCLWHFGGMIENIIILCFLKII